ncbi:hypothetical protein [Streptomyces shenzhenensis]|uniref:Uncharacterized protein n=1 Tax=Streptomyces shenzhenensis TaxID=943815 RepID=A0A3M0I059_9ACTN|nr:hypothetical protein [Streptomyces shenzhenensis]RMB81512.1 hypothetical protein CTZ28_34485 [Streptomyces shenzhenensis]
MNDPLDDLVAARSRAALATAAEPPEALAQTVPQHLGQATEADSQDWTDFSSRDSDEDGLRQ